MKSIQFRNLYAEIFFISLFYEIKYEISSMFYTNNANVHAYFHARNINYNLNWKLRFEIYTWKIFLWQFTNYSSNYVIQIIGKDNENHLSLPNLLITYIFILFHYFLSVSLVKIFGKIILKSLRIFKGLIGFTIVFGIIL